MHDSNHVDLWIEVRAAWTKLRWFMIRSCSIMTRQTGSLFRNTRFMIQLTGSLTSSGTVYLTNRNDNRPDDALSNHNSTTSPRVVSELTVDGLSIFLSKTKQLTGLICSLRMHVLFLLIHLLNSFYLIGFIKNFLRKNCSVCSSYNVDIFLEH